MEKVLDRVTHLQILLISVIIMLSEWAVVLLANGSKIDLVVGLVGGVFLGVIFNATVAWSIYIANGPSYAELLARIEQGEELSLAERLLLGIRFVPWGEVLGYSIFGIGSGIILWILNFAITMEAITGTWKTCIGGKGGISSREAGLNFLIYWLFAQTLLLVLFKRCWKKFELRFLDDSVAREKGVAVTERGVESTEQKTAAEKSISLRTFKVISPEGELKEMTIGPFVRDEKLAKKLAAHLEQKAVKLGDGCYVSEGNRLSRDALLAKIKEVAPDAVIAAKS
ncbi:hypothetical protein A2482_03855 [Candidatus Falkowbacteria bacterium RIFOXYC2_FULL_48_21]|uniref:Uncharacterized protein n=1 Tax=Candidatus Falkowbacteria bacterium RIFOXYC2_FULL_48_21 TaxID=1798005 RepID=A0A1F5T7V1_9BACT|nr:MAG: hypothetical protein A2482_03855 [Candidatus Falkowbacteria bacterium RIFOXYC2_FULL_48_21]